MRAGPLLLLLLAATSMNAYAFLGFGNSASWKEEVLLHDGRKIIVARALTHGGRGEIGQSPIKEQTLSFALPGAEKTITWHDEFSQDVGRASFLVLALHLLEQTPYLVVTPHLCSAYIKWGRPNPPYVVFKYDGNAWRRIPLEELPTEFKDVNIVYNTIGNEKPLVEHGFVTVEMVRKLNSNPKQQPEYKTIIRTPLVTGKNSASNVDCEEMISDGKNGWVGFNVSSMHSYDECIEVCKFHRLETQFCPCDNLLKTKPEWR
jgi:hypothetical protein